MKFNNIKDFLIYLFTFSLIWIIFDWIYSLLCAATFVILHAIRAALPAAVISYFILYVVYKKK